MPRAADAEPRPALELYLVVSTRAAVEHFHQVKTHDHGAMHTKEARRIQPLLERQHRVADDVAMRRNTVTNMQLRVGAARGDEVDVGDGHGAHLAMRFHRNALRVACRGRRGPLQRCRIGVQPSRRRR